jgi:hypothetical protein
MRRVIVAVTVIGAASAGLVGPVLPAGARVRPDGVVLCGRATGTKTFVPPLTSTPRTVTMYLSGQVTSCGVAFPVGGAEAITNFVLTGKARIRNATKAHHDSLNGAAIKLKIAMRSDTGLVCGTNARVAFDGYAPGWDPLHIQGGLKEPKYSNRAIKTLVGVKRFGAKCFAGRVLIFSLVHDARALPLNSIVNSSPVSIGSLTYTGATPGANRVGDPPVVPRFGEWGIG